MAGDFLISIDSDIIQYSFLSENTKNQIQNVQIGELEWMQSGGVCKDDDLFHEYWSNESVEIANANDSSDF